MNITLSKAEIEQVLDTLALCYYQNFTAKDNSDSEYDINSVYINIAEQAGYSPIVSYRYDSSALLEGKIVYK